MGIAIRNQDNENAFVINALDGQSSMIGQSHLYQHTSANMNLDTGENSLAVNSQEMIDHDQVNLEDSLDTAQKPVQMHARNQVANNSNTFTVGEKNLMTPQKKSR